MGRRPSEIVVLCEDLQAATFIRRALKLRVEARRLRFAPLPPGRGAGDASVRERYAGELAAERTRSARARSWLIVHMDCDPGHTPAQRQQELAGAAAAASQPPRSAAEPVCHLLPKRNIETWIHALDPTLAPSLARPLDEDAAYPKLAGREAACDAAARTFARLAAAGTAVALPLLETGLAEWTRLT